MKKLLLLSATLVMLTGCLSDGDPEKDVRVDDGSMTNLNIRLSGASSTRAMEGKGQTTPNTNKIENVHVFILDATGTDVTDYAPVTITSDLEAIRGAGWIFPDPIPVDSRVFVLGNVHRDYNRTVRNLETMVAIRAFTSDIWTQTDYDLASMAAVGDPVPLSITSSGSASVSVQLAPVISRLELHSLEAGGDVHGFTVTGIFLTNFHTAFTYGGGYPDGSTPIDNTTDLAPNNGMTGDQANVMAQGTPLRAEMTGNRIWAYNVVAGSLPLLVVRMKDVMVGSKLHPGPLYLTVSSYGSTTEFRAGKIYRVSVLRFTEDHLTLAPSTDGINVDPIEWDWEDIVDPGLTTPGTRINIVPVGGAFSGTFPATGAVAQTFNVNAGEKLLMDWRVELDDDTYFEIINKLPTSFDIQPRDSNLTTSPRTATATVTGTVESGTTRATSEVTSTYTVTQEGIAPIDESSKGNIIYFAGTGDETYLSLGTWSNNAADNDTPGRLTAANYQSKMATFKFGGIVGMDLVDRRISTVFSSDISVANNAVRFNPLPASFTISSFTSSSVSDYQNEINMSSPNVPGTLNATPVSYNGNNIAEVFDAWKVGKGDPCQLLGIPASKLKAALDANDGGVGSLPLRNRSATSPTVPTRQPTKITVTTWYGRLITLPLEIRQ